MLDSFEGSYIYSAFVPSLHQEPIGLLLLILDDPVGGPSETQEKGDVQEEGDIEGVGEVAVGSTHEEGERDSLEEDHWETRWKLVLFWERNAALST